METCVNCACQFQGPYQNCDGDDTFSRDVNLLNLYGPLSSIYKLNYLSSFLGSSAFENDSNINWKLCENCLETFNNLHQFYEDFNQLRSLESKLASEIQKLDDCIQNYQNQQQQKQLQAITLKQEDKKIKVETRVSKSRHRVGPIVVLQRLENDPFAQKYLTNSKCTIIKRRQSQKRTTKVVAVKVKNNDRLKSSALVKEIEKESADNFDSLCDDPFFVPSPQSERDGVDEDDHVPEVKKQKKTSRRRPVKTKAAQKRKSLALSDGLDPKQRNILRRRIHKKNLIHYKTRKTQVPNPCWECNLDFPTQKECYEHTMQEHAQPGELACQKCAKRLKTLHGLRLHEEQLCLSLKPGQLLPTFNCERCIELGKNATFHLEIRYREHLNNVHHDGEFKCEFPGCNYTTNAPATFYQHNKTQHQPDTIEDRTCPVCQKIFKTKVSCLAHHTNLHTPEGFIKYQEQLKLQLERSKVKNKDKPKLRDETFCSECMVDMLTHASLVLHRRSMHGEMEHRNYVCETCGKGFKKRYGLVYHEKHVHTEERLYCCDLCGARFKSNSNLQSHVMRTHDAEGRLKFNAFTRLINERKKIRTEALAQSLLAGIPQFTGANFVDTNSGNSSEVNAENTNTSAMELNIVI